MSLLRAASVALSAAALALTSACATTSDSARPAFSSAAQATETTPAAELRLGYFANVTHAGAVYGVGAGTYQAALGADTALRTQVFNAGPAAVEALFAGSLDAAYLGPNPSINAFVKSQGEAVRIVAGATSGGASLVVQPEITGIEQLRGTILATPQTGGTQDVALRTWLASHGLQTDLRGAGDATIRAQENAQTLREFQAGRIAGGWVPEPWASRLVLEGGGKVLVDEKTLWPGGRFVTTQLIVRTQYLRDHPQTVEALIRGQVEADRAIAADPAGAKRVINAELSTLTGKALAPATIDRAFASIEITEDPVASSLRTSAEHGFATGLVKQADLTGIYDLTILRKVLGKDVDDAGLGPATEGTS
ncbi:MAG: transporter substrate-binding protein [Frankiales bacterium]|nr:transporter substrate-binding protein [Frankiales bacterium]